MKKFLAGLFFVLFAAAAHAAGFTVSNGLILDPTGAPYAPAGININSEELGSPIQATFPGINFIRVPFHSYDAPSSVQTIVASLTSKGVVVELEDHTSIGKPPYTGSQLSNQLAWYASMAAAFKGNPYVWFGTLNESYSGNGNDVTTSHLAIYNAIRKAGNTAPVMLCMIGGGNPKSLPGGGDTPLTASSYANLTNVIWDYHFYNWATGYSTDANTIKNFLTKSFAAIQTVKSAGGLVPIVIGEFGPSTTGDLPDDPGGVTAVDAVLNNGRFGFAAWAWDAYGTSDQLVKNGSLTGYGTRVASGIKAVSGIPLPPPPPFPPPPPTGTTVLITPGVGSFTDTAGIVYTISTAGVAMANNGAIPGGNGTGAMEYYSGTVYGQDAASKAWYIWNGSSWVQVAAPPPPAATSPNDTVLRAGSTATIMDTNGVKWALVNGQVAVNGVADAATANVAEITYVGGKVWYQSGGSWFGKAKPADAWAPALPAEVGCTAPPV